VRVRSSEKDGESTSNIQLLEKVKEYKELQKMMRDIVEMFMRGYSQKRFKPAIECDKKLERDARIEKSIAKTIKNALASDQR